MKKGRTATRINTRAREGRRVLCVSVGVFSKTRDGRGNGVHSSPTGTHAYVAGSPFPALTGLHYTHARKQASKPAESFGVLGVWKNNLGLISRSAEKRSSVDGFGVDWMGNRTRLDGPESS